jgi:hypothetical protein
VSTVTNPETLIGAHAPESRALVQLEGAGRRYRVGDDELVALADVSLASPSALRVVE